MSQLVLGTGAAAFPREPAFNLHSIMNVNNSNTMVAVNGDYVSLMATPI